MENEKKPSRLGVRLSAMMVAVFLVVCMAVPAFAYSPEDIYGKWVFSETLDFSAFTGSGSTVVSLPVEFVCNVDGVDTTFYQLVFRYGGTVAGRIGLYDNKEFILCYKGVWKNDEYRYIDVVGYSFGNGSDLAYELFFTNASPPPPDPLGSVGAGLIVVLDWVGSVVSAVVSGPMSGLLILLAVPVAITLLLVAFIVIRRIIWGV